MKKFSVWFGLLVIWGIFALSNENFLSARNLSNLVLQITSMGTLSVALVLILLLGEIDLSIAAVSGLAAAVMGVLHTQHGFGILPAALVALLVGAAATTLQGAWFVRFKVPSFVVTLSGLLAFQGALLHVLGSTGAINLFDPELVFLTTYFLPEAFGYVVALGVSVVALGVELRRARRLEREKLRNFDKKSFGLFALLALGGPLFVTALLNESRGIPLALLVLLALVFVFDLLLTKTRFGRHVYAVGGNPEAARRAGIRIDRVRVGIFGIAGALAALSGILAASRLQAVNQSSGSGDVLLNAIAAAVIGGTSLFGGRGSVWSALTGALVIGSISNGMDLLALPSSVKFMVTGLALLFAVTLDAVSRGKVAISSR